MFLAKVGLPDEPNKIVLYLILKMKQLTITEPLSFLDIQVRI